MCFMRIVSDVLGQFCYAMNATSTLEYVQLIQEAAHFILERLGPAKIALVLGSGLGPFVDYLTDTKEIDFKVHDACAR